MNPEKRDKFLKDTGITEPAQGGKREKSLSESVLHALLMHESFRVFVFPPQKGTAGLSRAVLTKK